MQQSISWKKICLFLSILCVIFLIINFSVFHQRINLAFLLIFIIINLSIFFYLIHFFSNKVSLVESKIENTKEQVNIITVENKRFQEAVSALKFKITRYDNLSLIHI